MARSSLSVRACAALALLLAAAVAVSGCGRRGAPEAPPSSRVLTTNAEGEVVEKPAEQPDRPFILDPLLQ